MAETTYIVLGVKLPYTYFSEEEREALADGKYGDNPYESKIGSNDEMTVILDGMDGKYIVVGKVLLKARHHEGDGVAFTELDISDSAREIVQQKIQEHFSVLHKVHPMVFTHYT